MFYQQPISVVQRARPSYSRSYCTVFPALPPIARPALGGVQLRHSWSRFHHTALLLALLHHVCLGHLLASLSIVAYYRIHSQAIVANCARTHLCDLLSASNFLSAGHRVVSLHNRHLYPHKNSANAGRMERKSMACAGTGGLRRCRLVSCAAGLPRPVLYCA